MTQPPCKDCTGRYIGCHSGCPTWKEWKTEDEREKAEIAEKKSADKQFMEIESAGYFKRMKRAHRHG